MNDLALYNEIDDFAADWLENLIRAGEIAPGRVERRSIVDLTPDDILPYRQFHAFAGIGIWSAALRAAGVRDDQQVWTGSCPCQPFSTAGKGGGFDDERHLWPAFHWLIAQCRPGVVLGEQVASKDGLAWLDLVQSDLEGTGYAAGAVDMCSASFGAPHIRQRLYWLALDNAADARHDDARQHDGGPSLLAARSVEPSRISKLANAAFGNQQRHSGDARSETGARGGEAWPTNGNANRGASTVRKLALTDNPIGRTDATGRHERDRQDAGRAQGAGHPQGRGELGQLADADNARSQGRAGVPQRADQRTVGPVGMDGGMADSASDGRRQERAVGGRVNARDGAQGQPARLESSSDVGGIGHNAGPELDRPGPVNGFWRNSDWLFCRDGKWWPVEAGTQPLAHGLPRGMGNLSPELQRLAGLAGLSNKSLARAKAHRVGSLRGYGNAINFEQAVQFIGAAFGAD